MRNFSFKETESDYLAIWADTHTHTHPLQVKYLQRFKKKTIQELSTFYLFNVLFYVFKMEFSHVKITSIYIQVNTLKTKILCLW